MKKIFTCVLCLTVMGIFWPQISRTQNNTYTPLELGVNVNERPHWLKPELLEQSRTTWVRAFIEASHYITGERSLNDDFRIKALKETANGGYKVLLSIKWNLKEAGWRIPEPGSSQEKEWFQFAGDLLEKFEGDLSMLVLVNEITIDIPEEDLQPDGDGVIPFVRFQKRLLDYVSGLEPKDAGGGPLPVYTGGFTRLDRETLQNHPANRAMFEWINEDKRLAGADFHIHQPDYQTSIESAAFIRGRIPHKSLIVTEFSLVWKWKKHLSDYIGSTADGLEFAEHYGLDPEMTVADYSTKAFADPVSETEWNDFLKSQNWFEPYYLDVMGRIMEHYNIDVATYAFTQNPQRSTPVKVTPESNPWFIHQIFVPGTAHAASDRTAENYGIFDSFTRWQKVNQTMQPDIMSCCSFRDYKYR